jgi:hypothetical protein
MSSKSFIVRQGDVLLRRIQSIPSDAKPTQRDNGRVILAYGEVTGHAHAILEPTTVKLAKGIAEYLDAPEGATILHEEHDTILLPPGKYQIVHQREYSPAEIRRVRD